MKVVKAADFELYSISIDANFTSICCVYKVGEKD